MIEYVTAEKGLNNILAFIVRDTRLVQSIQLDFIFSWKQSQIPILNLKRI